MKRGDRVKVEYEGTLIKAEKTGFWVRDDYGMNAHVRPSHLTKVEPPVETFVPGDRIRSRVFGWEYTIGIDGYFCHDNNTYHNNTHTFKSDKYDLVTRG